MRPLLLQTVARILIPVQFALSLYFLLRGHNDPGGGFVGGLVAASAMLLFAMSFGFGALNDLMPFSWFALVRIGLALALLSGSIAIFFERPFLSALWGTELALPIVGNIKLGSVLLFDIGVYLLVAGFSVGLALYFTEQDAEEVP